MEDERWGEFLFGGMNLSGGRRGQGKEKGVELVVWWWWYVAAIERSVLYIHTAVVHMESLILRTSYTLAQTRSGWLDDPIEPSAFPRLPPFAFFGLLFRAIM
jgi:hypothetical protein